jgi:HEAT repeat protein
MSLAHHAPQRLTARRAAATRCGRPSHGTPAAGRHRISHRRLVIGLVTGAVAGGALLATALADDPPALVAAPPVVLDPQSPEVTAPMAEAPTPAVAAPRAIKVVAAPLPRPAPAAPRLSTPPALNAPGLVAGHHGASDRPGGAVVRLPAKRPVNRRDTATEAQLRRQLAEVPEVGIGRAGERLVWAYTSHVQNNLQATGDVNLSEPFVLLKVVPGTATLPLRSGTSAVTPAKAAATLAVLAQKLRAYLAVAAPVGPDGRRAAPGMLAAALRKEKRGERPEWLRAEAVPTMLQLLSHEDAPVRAMLVELLAEIRAPVATEALARRAVFDLDAAVRARAAAALAGRPADEYRQVLLAALRYPWAPAADHAAEALVMLRDRAAVPALVTLLREPDPSAPRRNGGGYIVQEVVRARHVTNCLMCHPPSLNGEGFVHGVDPVWAMRRRVALSGAAAAAGRGTPGGGGGGGGWGRGGSSTSVGVETPLTIRADIIYLRQDFSVQLPDAGLPVVNPGAVVGPVPEFRFDFLVHKRPLTRAELARRKDAPAAASYPQRDAVLFALRALTGRDAGSSTDAWVRLYPTAQVDVEAARLADRLVRADPARLGVLLRQSDRMADDVCTAGLCLAIDRLRGPARDQVRDALAQRFARLDPDALRARLRTDDPEVRTAAIAACGRKKDVDLVPDVVGFLEDPDPAIVQQAERALQRMTGRRLASAAAWRDWCQKEKPR